MRENVVVRQLQESDIADADRIFRLAFGTFLGLPDPMAFSGDAAHVKTRWHANPEGALGAFAGGELVGINVLTRWGSFGTFGPLAVRPDLWDQGVAQKLLAETANLFSRWGTEQAGLFTFSHSTKHVGLYQKFGFWPQQLTTIMVKQPGPAAAAASEGGANLFSSLGEEQCQSALAECRSVASALYPGMDLRKEITAVAQQGLGDTVLLRSGGELVGFAVCHTGPGSEAGSGSAYVKFGAVRPGRDASEQFASLLSSCEALAAARGATEITAGVNTARHGAYRRMLDSGYRSVFLGVAMQQPNNPGFNRPDCFVMDDWR